MQITAQASISTTPTTVTAPPLPASGAGVVVGETQAVASSFGTSPGLQSIKFQSVGLRDGRLKAAAAQPNRRHKSSLE